MSKRVFEVLDQMNQDDAKNGTRLVAVATTFLSSKLTKQGTEVTMGCSTEVSRQLLNDEVMPVLVIINKKEYFKRNPA